jgi:hypothetical protein
MPCGSLHCFCRPEGRRMVPRPESECSTLFREALSAVQQQQQLPVPSSSTCAPAAGAGGTVDQLLSSRSQHQQVSGSAEQPRITNPTAACHSVHSHSDGASSFTAAAAGAGAAPAVASARQLDHQCVAVQQQHSSSSSSSSSSAVERQPDPRFTAQLQALQALQPAGDLGSGRTGVAPRVQDNPDYFRT